MSPFFYVLMVLVVAGIVMAAWSNRRRRPDEDGIRFVYINQDGSARELTESEREYLETNFQGGDGGRPSVKSRYECKDGWGSVSGFIDRRRVPALIPIAKIPSAVPQNDVAYMDDVIADAEAVGDLIERGSDGSITITPNRAIGRKERFRLLAERQLQRQRSREEAVMKLANKDSVEQGVAPNDRQAPQQG